MGSLSTKGFGFEINWFIRVLNLLPNNRCLFIDKQDAQYTLGIGNAKIIALESWLLSAELTVKCKENKQFVTYLSPLGEIIKEHDPNFYDYNTLAVVSYHLSKGPKKQGSEVVYWYMNRLNYQEFTRDQLRQALQNDYPHLKKSSIDNGLQALLQVFRLTPFGSEFRLLVEIQRNHFRKEEPPEQFIHPLIFAYAIADWAKEHDEWTVPVEYIKMGECLPGKCFNISSKRIDKYLDIINNDYSEVILVSKYAGLNKVYIKEKEPLKILRQYYKQA